jgi:uncharacterized protein (TIGR02271 family)
MITTEQVQDVIGQTLVSSDGSKIGKIGQVYLDDETGRPEWVTVSTGLFGTSESFAPVADATFDGTDVVVAFDKDRVKGAPRIDADGSLSEADEDELYTYYGMGTQGVDASTTRTDGTTAGLTGRTDTDTRTTGVRDTDTRSAGHDTSGPSTDDAMTRSEERLRVGTQSREAGRARLRKHVVTEQQSVTVPVSHEEVTLSREPITDANRAAAGAGPDISEEEHEVVLHEERPVVDKTVEAVERVALGTKTVTEDTTVTDSVRKEQIELDADQGVDTTRTTRD